MRRSALLLFAVSSLWATLAAAATAPEPETKAAAAAAADPRDGGRWNLALDTAADGTKVVVATLAADAPIPSGFGETTPQLVVRYRSGQASAYIVFDTFLGTGKAIETRVKFGDAPVERQSWRISADSRSAFVAGEPLAFVERLKGIDSLSVQIAPNGKKLVTVSFSPAGIEIVMKALISAGVKYGN